MDENEDRTVQTQLVPETGPQESLPEDCTCEWNELANIDRTIVTRVIGRRSPECPLHRVAAAPRG